jgi:hypothetical protein
LHFGWGEQLIRPAPFHFGCIMQPLLGCSKLV